MEEAWMRSVEALGGPRIIAVGLAAARLAGILFVLPLGGARLLSVRMRAAVLLSILLALPVGAPLAVAIGRATGISAAAATEAPVPAAAIPSGPGAAALLLGGEVLVGTCLGWFAVLVLASVRGAAALLSDQIGFSLGGVMDPLAEGSEPSLKELQGLLAIFIFLALDVHLVFLKGIAGSFEVLPPGRLGLEGAIPALEGFVALTGARLFEAALVVAFPAMAALLLATVVHGILTRAVPELEFFVFGFPLRAFVGLGVTILSLPFFAGVLEGFLGTALRDGENMLRRLAG